MWASVSPSAGPVGAEEGGPRGGPERLVNALPEAPSRAAMKPGVRAGQADRGGGIARRGNLMCGQPRGQLRAEDRGESARVSGERAAPANQGREGQRAAALAPTEDPPRRALRGAADEHLFQSFAAHFDRIVRARLLKGGQGRERRVRLSPALIAHHADVRGDGVEEDEVAEVVAVSGEAAVGAAAQAARRLREREPARAGQVPGELRIGLERRARRAYGDQSFAPWRPGEDASTRSLGRFFFGPKEGYRTPRVGADQPRYDARTVSANSSRARALRLMKREKGQSCHLFPLGVFGLSLFIAACELGSSSLPPLGSCFRSNVPVRNAPKVKPKAVCAGTGTAFFSFSSSNSEWAHSGITGLRAS